MKKTLVITTAITAALCFSAPVNAQVTWPSFGRGGDTASVFTQDPQRGVMTLAPLLEQTTPAVVTVTVTRSIKSFGFQNDQRFGRFFNDNKSPKGLQSP